MYWVIISIILLVILFYLNINWKPIIPPYIKQNKMLIIGHRGAPANECENTLKSFKSAIKQGLDGIELDVQFTLDKKLIVYHDWIYVDRSGNKILIENTPYSTLKKFKLTNEPESNMPQLSQVLDILPNNCIKIIEIKSKYVTNTGIEKKILIMLEKYDIINNCVISSFNPFIIRRIRNINPNIQTAFLWTLDNPQFTINTPLWVWWCKPDGFHADINHLDRDLVDWVHRYNMSLFAYTIIYEKQYNKAIRLGLDGIFIDDPNLKLNLD